MIEAKALEWFFLLQKSVKEQLKEETCQNKKRTSGQTTSTPSPVA